MAVRNEIWFKIALGNEIWPRTILGNEIWPIYHESLIMKIQNRQFHVSVH